MCAPADNKKLFKFQLDFQLDDRSLDLYIQHKMNVYMVIYVWPKLVHLIHLHTVSIL